MTPNQTIQELKTLRDKYFNLSNKAIDSAFLLGGVEMPQAQQLASEEFFGRYKAFKQVSDELTDAINALEAMQTEEAMALSEQYA